MNTDGIIMPRNYQSYEKREPGYVIGICGIERYNNHLKHQKQVSTKEDDRNIRFILPFYAT